MNDLVARLIAVFVLLMATFLVSYIVLLIAWGVIALA